MQTVPNTGELVEAIVSLIGAGGIAAAAIAKFSAMARKGRVETFKESLAAQREEIDRCNKRIEELDADVERERKDKHDWRNRAAAAEMTVARYEMKFGLLPELRDIHDADPQRKSGPGRRVNDNDENGDPR